MTIRFTSTQVGADGSRVRAGSRPVEAPLLSHCGGTAGGRGVA